MSKMSLLEARLKAGFGTQKELADAARVSKSMVWVAENPTYQQRHLGRKSAFRILGALRARGIDLTINDIDWNVRDMEV